MAKYYRADVPKDKFYHSRISYFLRMLILIEIASNFTLIMEDIFGC